MTWKVRQHANGTYLVFDDEGWYVMSCQDGQRAQLVASAPQMLEALEKIADLADRLSHITYQVTREDLETLSDYAANAITAVKEEDDIEWVNASRKSPASPAAVKGE